MRGDFNIVFDEYLALGDGSLGPLSRSGVEGRFVLQREVFGSSPPLSLRSAWLTCLTMPLLPLSTISTVGIITIDLRRGAFIAIPSGSAPTWRVVGGEVVLPHGRDPYVRAWLRDSNSGPF